ncbi:TAPT1 [Cordylochernes scorpioides]|uniref:TAPT1 n=1 Tax=Cordylochernes scorpioides TaxID=51811 RepID=A0ABY6KX83_9ARAC|nr:TAPT1 [Cordylochernes scorpioides]
MAAAPNMEYKRCSSCIPGLGAFTGYYQLGHLSPGPVLRLPYIPKGNLVKPLWFCRWCIVERSLHNPGKGVLRSADLAPKGMAASDMRNRRHVQPLLTWSTNAAHPVSLDQEPLQGRIWFLLYDCSMVFLFEVTVDWVKHGFITKFNDIPSEVYSEYTISLAYDMASSKLKNAYSDHADLVSRRMGFMPIPLTALLLRTPCAATPNMEYKRCSSCIPGLGALTGYYQLGQLNPGFLVSLLLLHLLLFHPGLGPAMADLVALKMAINLYLLGKACDHIDRHRQAKKALETRQCASLPSTPPHHRLSLEEERIKLISAQSLPQTPQRSQTSSLEDIAAHVERLHHGAIEPNPIFSDSTVNLQQWQISPMGILTPSRESPQQRRISLQTT